MPHSPIPHACRSTAKKLRRGGGGDGGGGGGGGGFSGGGGRVSNVTTAKAINYEDLGGE